MISASKMAAVALKLITNAGQDVTLTKLTAGTFSGVLGGYTGQTSTDYTVKAYLDNYKDSMIDGTMVQRGDRLAYIANTEQPLIDNVVTASTIDYKVLNVKSINVGGTVVLYEAQLRT